MKAGRAFSGLAVALLGWGTAHAEQIPWGAPVPIATGTEPSRVAVGDLDRDGDLDVVTVDPAASLVVAWMNGGAGASWTSVALDTGMTAPDGVIVADLDRDGDLDVIASSSSAGSMTAYLYEPFTASWTSLVLDSPSAGGDMAVGDLDRNGVREIAVGGSGAGTAFVHRFDPPGVSIGPADLPGAHAGLLAVDIGDANQDARGDVLLVSSVGVELWTNDGSDFAAGGSVSGSLSSISVAAGAVDAVFADIDGDSYPDIVVGSTAGDAVVWHLNDRSGSFGAAAPVLASTMDTSSVRAVDLDRDGDPDLLVTVTTTDSVWFIENLGGGASWAAHLVTDTLVGASDAWAGDVDSDGDLDLIAVGTGGAITWLPNERLHGAVSFGDTTQILSGMVSAQRFRLADLDHDGDLDAVGSEQVNFNQQDGFSYAVQNTSGDGAAWGAPFTIAQFRANPRDVEAADLDGDGHMDAAMLHAGSGTQVEWVRNTAGTTTSFSASNFVSFGTGCWHLRSADLDNDGDLDLVRTCNAGNTVQWLRNDGDGASWTSCVVHSNFANAQFLDVADIDRDGDDDLVVMSPGGSSNAPTIRWLVNDQTCGGWNGITIVEASGPGAMVAGDVDGDGDPDVVLKTSAGLVWYRNVDPLVAWPFGGTIAASDSSGAYQAVDFDYDGDLDIIGAGNNGVRWFENTAGNATAWSARSTTLASANNPLLADLDRDGDLDVAVTAGTAWQWVERVEQLVDLSGVALGVARVEETASAALVRIDVDHRLARAGDRSLELGRVRLSLRDEDGNAAMTSGEAAQAFASISVYADSAAANGTFEPSDPLLISETSLSLSGGVLDIEVPSGANNSVAVGSERAWFVVVEVASTAVAASLADLSVSWAPMVGGTVDYAGTDISVLLDGAPLGATAAFTVDPLDSDDDGDPDTSDCEDNDPSIHAGATELCDGVDQDCDSDEDEDFDGDGDGYYDESAAGCAAAWGTPGLLDCDDGDGTINPLATELCDGVDEDCDGAIDDGFDLDNDGAFDRSDAGCLATWGAASDCDDAAPSIHPGATEVCDTVDQDCDGTTDEGFDADSDGFYDGDDAGCVSAYAQVDCDDGVATTHPGITEICDAVDDDCDGATDEDFDGDSDSFTTCGVDGVTTGPGVGTDDDCDDGDSAIRPGAAETCDAVDSDCDGSIVDEDLDTDGDLTPDCEDLDDDEDGDPDATDCASTDPSIYADAPESCDLIDSDCDGSIVDDDDDFDSDLTPDCVDDDDDDDGMPDTWEVDNDLDPRDASDASSDTDGDGRSALDEYLGGTNPEQYDGPAEVALLSPVNGEHVTTALPTLVVENGVHPLGDALVYVIEVYEDAALSTLVAASGDVVEGGTDTRWTMEVSLSEDTAYWWRAAAADDWIQGAWSDPTSFFVDVDGDAPSLPAIVFPVTGEVMEANEQELVWLDSVSPQGQELDYVVRLLPVGSDTALASATIRGTELLADETWAIPIPLQAGTQYRWTVEALDQSGRTSGETPPRHFWFQITNTPPSAPVFLSPQQDDVLADPSPDVVFAESFDPEGGAIIYALDLDTSAAFTDPRTVAGLGDGVGQLTLPLSALGIVLDEQATWFLRLVARDVNGASSQSEVISVFVRGANDAPAVPTLEEPTEQRVTGQLPTFRVSGGADPEGDPTTLEIRVSRDRSGSDLIDSGEAIDGAWTSTTELAGGHWWSARSIDSFGATSAWAAPVYFVAIDPGWGCSAAGRGAAGWAWLALGGLGLWLRRRAQRTPAAGAGR